MTSLSDTITSLAAAVAVAKLCSDGNHHKLIGREVGYAYNVYNPHGTIQAIGAISLVEFDSTEQVLMLKLSSGDRDLCFKFSENRWRIDRYHRDGRLADWNNLNAFELFP